MADEPQLTTTRELSRDASGEEHALRCHVCGAGKFSILQGNEDLEEDLEWLRVFHRNRLRPGAPEKDIVDFTQREMTNVVECRGCGTIYRNPQLKPEALAERYRHDEYGKETLESLLANELPFFEAKASSIEGLVPPAARVLEIGSFVGAFLRIAEAKGWAADGVDIGDETSRFCREKGLEVRNMAVENSGYAAATFDAVFVWNTFDQVPSPRELLGCCRRIVKDDGLLVVRIPNGSFYKRVLDLRGSDPERARRMAAYNNFVPFPYLAGYTSRSIELLLHQQGFDVIEVRGDTILPLSSDDTTENGVIEENRTKRLVTRWATLLQEEQQDSLFPWLDVLARATWKGPEMHG